MPTSKSVTVKIAGGLGNQMFQYAAARALALRRGGEMELDLRFFGSSRRRQFGLDGFAIVATRLVPSRAGFWARLVGAKSTTPVYREPYLHFDPALLDLKLPVRLEGYFQSARYFADCEATIRRELAPAAATDTASLEMARAMRETQAVALHVRRGDYVSNARVNTTQGTCSVAYYQRAMEQLPANATVFVFSDDVAWARANLPAVRQLVFVDGGDRRPPVADLWLMTLAQHHIIANSTFSWWGAWLAQPANGLKIAPARWFADPALDDRDIVPAAWIRLPS